MATLPEVYKKVKPSIVAFVQTVHRVADRSKEPVPKFPRIFGTGFVVDERGIIATNQHVVDAFSKVPTAPGEPPVLAVVFVKAEDHIKILPVRKIREMFIASFRHGENYSGPPSPDIALVKIAARNLPALELDSEIPSEGDEVATSGFPMGTRAFVSADGRLEQLTPTLQRGIVSAILPFPCPYPHGLVLNMMVQGGASGSPVFNTKTGKIGGAISGRRFDTTLSVTWPTNYSLAVPARYIQEILTHARGDAEFMSIDGIPTIEEIIATRSTKDIQKDSGFKFVPDAEIGPGNGQMETVPPDDTSAEA